MRHNEQLKGGSETKIKEGHFALISPELTLILQKCSVIHVLYAFYRSH